MDVRTTIRKAYGQARVWVHIHPSLAAAAGGAAIAGGVALIITRMS